MDKHEDVTGVMTAVDAAWPAGEQAPYTKPALKDKDIREPLFMYLEENFAGIRLIEEKQIGKTRADVLMVMPDKLIGIEIKSDKNTYVRLQRQVKDYNRFFDSNLVVVGATHAHHVEDYIPEYWGILVAEQVDGVMDFYMLRQMKPNPKRERKVMFRNQLSFLWRNELLTIQRNHGFPKYPGKSKRYIAEYLMERIDETQLKAELCDALLQRDYSLYEKDK